MQSCWSDQNFVPTSTSLLYFWLDPTLALLGMHKDLPKKTEDDEIITHTLEAILIATDDITALPGNTLTCATQLEHLSTAFKEKKP